MAKLLAEAYDDVVATLQRNRKALDRTIDVLLEQTSMSGQQVRWDTAHQALGASLSLSLSLSLSGRSM